MNLKNPKPFNADGPIKFSEPDFEAYQTTVKDLNFDDMFYYWLNENNPNPIRQLMLRDLLRQGGCDSSRVCHRTFDHTFRIVFLNDNEEGLGGTLRQNFINRPKLLQEFSSELLYLLDQEIIVIPKNSDKRPDPLDFTCYLEVLIFSIPFLPTAEANQIWQHEKHLSAHLKPCERVNIYLYLLNYEQSKFPATIRQEVWQLLQEELKTDLDSLTKSQPEHPTHIHLDDKTVLRRTVERIVHLACSYDTSEPNPAYGFELATFVKFFETQLPSHYCYLPVDYVIKTAYILAHAAAPQYLYSFLLRHLSPVDHDPEYHSPFHPGKSDIDFIFWLQGFMAADLVGDSAHRELKDKLALLTQQLYVELSAKLRQNVANPAPYEF